MIKYKKSGTLNEASNLYVVFYDFNLIILKVATAHRKK